MRSTFFLIGRQIHNSCSINFKGGVYTVGRGKDVAVMKIGFGVMKTGLGFSFKLFGTFISN